MPDEDQNTNQAGGEGAGTGSEAEDQTQTTTPEGGEGGSKGESDSQTTLTKDQLIEKLTNDLNDAKGKYDDISSKLGKQSAQIKTLRDFSKKMKEDPKGMAAKILKDAGIKAAFDGDKAIDLGKAMSIEDESERAAAAKTYEEQMQVKLQNQLKSVLAPVQEHILSTRHADWDDLGDTRDSLSLAVASGQMSETELTHLAARGLGMGDALKEAGKLAVEEYKESLAQKGKEQVSRGAGTDEGGSEDAPDLTNILEDLKNSEFA